MGKNRTNSEWLQNLSAGGAEQASAIEELRPMLLRAALAVLFHHLGNITTRTYEEIQCLAEDCTQEALVLILAHLGCFRGESRFTTWAYKFAVNRALVTARHEHLKAGYLDQYSVNLAPNGSFLVDGSASPDPELSAQQHEIRAIIKTTLQNELTPLQRKVVESIVFKELPVEKVVEQLQTNRNAVYKLLHDARQKIKVRLVEKGFDPQYVLWLFSAQD